MAFNLIDLVKDEMSGQMMQQMGGLLGNDASKIESGFASALPGLLNGLTERASMPGGADALLGTIQDQDDGLLGNIGAMLGGNEGNALLDGGVKALTGLFGSSGLGTLGSIVSGVSGMSSGGSKSLLGLIAPMVLGVIKRKVLGGGLDAGGLLSMMKDQKSNIDMAMPSGMSQAFSSSNLLSDFGGNVSNAVGDAKDFAVDGARGAVDTANQAAAKTSSGFMKYLPWLAAALIAIFGLKHFMGSGGDVVDQAKESAASVADTVSEAADIDLDGLTQDFTGVFDSAESTLGGITDVESAKASIPDLTEMTDKFSGLAGTLDKLPDAAKGPLMGIITTGLETLTPLLEKVRAIPGVGEVIDPIIQPMLDTLQSLAGS